MDKKYIAVFLIGLVLGAESRLPEKLSSSLSLSEQRWDGLGISANINEYVDNTISMLVPFIESHAMDPMQLPDLEEGFEVRPVLITYSAWLRLTNGFMAGLVNIERHGDQKVFYFAKMVRVRLEFKASDLQFVYRYLLKVMNIGPTGGIIGSLDHLTAVADVLVDFNNDEIHLQEFALNDIGRMRVRLTGNPLVDWLVNPTVSVFVRLFDTVIIQIVEVNIRTAINDGITLINSNVKTILENLE